MSYADGEALSVGATVSGALDGMAIGVIIADKDTFGIDTAEDYAAFVKSYALAHGRTGDSQ